jgi:CheY-like chemotaxis protein
LLTSKNIMVLRSSPGDGLRALVVDDNADAATSLSALLETVGCETAVAFGGDSAVRVALEFHPNLVLLDLEMPGRDGCETLRALQQCHACSHGAYFVCVTGRTDGDTRAKCLKSGFERFCEKPLTSVELSEILAVSQRRAGH